MRAFLIFIACEDSVNYIDHGKVLKPAIGHMTRSQAEDYVKICNIMPISRMNDLRLIDLRKYISIWVKQQETQLPTVRPLLGMTGENYRFTAIMSTTRDLIFIADIDSSTILEVTITVVGFNMSTKVVSFPCHTRLFQHHSAAWAIYCS